MARYGIALSLDALMMLGLFLLLFEGILVYDLVLRNPILKIAAVMPVHEGVVRRAYRQQSLLVLGALSVAALLSAVAVHGGSRELSPFLLISIPIWVALPVYGGVLCQLLRNVGASRQETRLGKVLGQELLPSDLSPVIYGVSMAFGGLGTWLMVLYFSNRLWVETGTYWPLALVITLGLLFAVLCLLWSDKYGPPAIVDACARLVFLDRQGLLLASRHQKTSREISMAKSPVSVATLVRVQVLRRSPLYPLFVLFLALVFWSRSSSFGFGAMAAAAALGLILDVPARWIHERLLTADLLQIIRVRELGPGNPTFVRGDLKRFAFLLQSLVVGTVVLVGAGLGRPLEHMLYLGFISLGVAWFAGFVCGLRIHSGWPVLRVLLILAALSMAYLPSGAFV